VKSLERISFDVVRREPALFGTGSRFARQKLLAAGAPHLFKAGLEAGVAEHTKRLGFSFWNADGEEYTTKTQRA